MIEENNINICDYNTFSLNAVSKTLLHIQTEEDLESITYDSEMVILGGGSNTVFAKSFIEQPVLRIENKGIKVLEDNMKDVVVEVAAGESWSEFVVHCCNEGWCGIENLAAIFGTVGAAPVQNIGAYGVEVKQFIVSVRSYDLLAKQWKDYDNQSCDFAYRSSRFKHQNKNEVIWNVVLKLQKDFSPNLSYSSIAKVLDKKTLKTLKQPIDLCNLVTRLRDEKLPNPQLLPNVGSFFKNPLVPMKRFLTLKSLFPDMVSFDADTEELMKISAAWLIEKAGWKGRVSGTVAMHSKQALVMVAVKPTNGDDILALAEAVMKDVKHQFNVELELEAHIIR
ncbi:MAG: UDP-N-acetylmuramate dehydrogenase [Bacteroidales bacterium]|jgi:UDP-N-acetylmuramate dehydrogenase|nr:UDP-N-acetylmuramate dehydrogenase [Bacteroidales bacterium]